MFTAAHSWFLPRYINIFIMTNKEIFSSSSIFVFDTLAYLLLLSLLFLPVGGYYTHPHNYCDQSRTSFTRFVYNWAGEPYVPAGSSKLVPERFKGKRLGVPVAPATFGKVEYKPEPYTGGVIKYAGSPEALKWTYTKPVFMSKDFSKTDEFSGQARMVVYREQVAKELKVAESALKKAAEIALAATQHSDGGSSGRLPPFSPMKGSGHEASDSGRSPQRHRASPTQFDRLRDHRTVKEVYNMTEIYKTNHSGMDFGPSPPSSHDYAEALPTPEEMRKVVSPNKRVAVTKQFVRQNGAWAAVTGKMP